VLRIHSTIQYMYSLNGTYLKEENEQKDLGVIISNDLKPGKHVNHIVIRLTSALACFVGVLVVLIRRTLPFYIHL